VARANPNPPQAVQARRAGQAVTNSADTPKLQLRVGQLLVIRVYDGAGNVIETHDHAGDFKEW